MNLFKKFFYISIILILYSPSLKRILDRNRRKDWLEVLQLTYTMFEGDIHKPRRQDFAHFCPPIRRQVYHISLCCSIGIWLTPSPAYVVYGFPQTKRKINTHCAYNLLILDHTNLYKDTRTQNLLLPLTQSTPIKLG